MTQIASLTRRIEQFMHSLPDGLLMMSFPRAGQICAAQITCLADNSRHANAWAKGVYQAARGRGCDHTHAIRILARAWLRVIWRAWTDHKPYDPSLHGSAVALASSQEG